MLTSGKRKEMNVAIALRRMRETSELTMRQAAALVGISHVTISQFENQKLSLPDYRIEQLLKAYGYKLEDLNKILGKAPVTSPLDDCHSMIDKLTAEQLTAVRGLLVQLLPKVLEA